MKTKQKFYRNILATLIFALFLAVNATNCYGQQNYRIDFAEPAWKNGAEGYTFLDLPKTNENALLPAEFKDLKVFAIFNTPFQILPETAGKCATTKEGTEQITLSVPNGAREILFVMVADFPKEELSGSWALPTPVNILAEPERAEITLVYTDGEKDKMMPVNADFKCYGISHGRALYSVVARKGKTISFTDSSLLQ